MPDPNGLREAIARTLATEKCYDLARVCKRFGLAPGDDTNPCSSRRIYVLRCLQEHNEDEAAAVAEAVLGSYNSPDLREKLHLYRQGPQPTLSELTRRKVLNHLAELGDQLSGRLGLIELLERVWPLRDMPSSGRYNEDFSDEIWQHMISNPGDWEYSYLFERLGALTDSDRRFMDFLELCVDPIVRDGAEQEALVASLNALLRPDGFALQPGGQVSGATVYRTARLVAGVAGAPKNLIFAAGKYKPDLVLVDAINNDVRIVRNEEHCLVYSQPIPETGLRWLDLVRWWAARTNTAIGQASERALYDRLEGSLASNAERSFFRRYFVRLRNALGERLPALIPQVYLHYDPKTVAARAQGKVLPRQRMDFLLLFSARDRVVIEIDGRHHYAREDGRASPELYSEMVAADRDLRLFGYEVYRFGGYELMTAGAAGRIDTFLEALLSRHRVG